MPEPPAGEADLRDLALRFMKAEGGVLAYLAEAAVGNQRRYARLALEELTELRTLDARGPVAAAYMAENPDGARETVRDLAGSLAKRLDQGAQTASDGARDAFRRVTPDNVEELVMSPLTAAIDRQGNHWALGSWAEMNTLTIGRHATSRGLSDRLGEGGKVVINVGRCQLCQSHAGEAVIGEVALPPFHPSCTCTASRA